MKPKFLLTLAAVLGIAAVVIWIATRSEPTSEISETDTSGQGDSKLLRPNGTPPAANPSSKTERPKSRPAPDNGLPHQSDPAAKTVVGILSGDLALLREGIAADPLDPHLLYLGATHAALPDEERLVLSKRLYEAAPTNALAAYIHAGRLMQAEETENAIDVLASAASKSELSDYFSLTGPLTVSAYQGVGTYNPSEAMVLSLNNSQRPYLPELRSLVTSLMEQAKSLPEAERTEIQDLAASMGARLEEHTRSAMLADQRVGIALAQDALAGLPDSAPSPYDNLTVAEARATLADNLAQLKETAEMKLGMDELLSQDPGLIDRYVERVRAHGEQEAVRWMHALLEEDTPAPDENGG